MICEVLLKVKATKMTWTILYMWQKNQQFLSSDNKHEGSDKNDPGQMINKDGSNKNDLCQVIRKVDASKMT